MKYMKMFIKPELLGEVALKRSEVAAVGLNAFNGALVGIGAALCMGELLTPKLILALGLLLGPLLAFIVSSVYARAEFLVGKGLGGKAQLNQLYRLGTWALTPVGYALLLYFGLLIWLNPQGWWGLWLALPSLLILTISVRTYFLNQRIVQQFSRFRALICFVFAFVLFAAAMYLLGESVRWLFSGNQDYAPLIFSL